MIKAGNHEGPPGGMTFELGVRRLTARTQAGRKQGGKRQIFRSGPGRACIGGKAGNEFHTLVSTGSPSSRRSLVCQDQERLRGSGVSATLLLGLPRPHGCLILEGKGVPFGLGVVGGESQLALCLPPYSLFRKTCSPRKAWRFGLSGGWHFDSSLALS